jgi:hypothetical protein
MTEPIATNNPITLACHIENGSLQVSHAGMLLSSEPYPVPSGTTSITFSDFEHDGNLCRVNAFTIGVDGGLEPWARTADGVSWSRAATTQAYDLHVIVVPVAHAPAGAVSGRILSVFQPDSWHALVHVNVPTDGTRPGG